MGATAAYTKLAEETVPADLDFWLLPLDIWLRKEPPTRTKFILAENSMPQHVPLLSIGNIFCPTPRAGQAHSQAPQDDEDYRRKFRLDDLRKEPRQPAQSHPAVANGPSPVHELSHLLKVLWLPQTFLSLRLRQCCFDKPYPRIQCKCNDRQLGNAPACLPSTSHRRR